MEKRILLGVLYRTSVLGGGGQGCQKAMLRLTTLNDGNIDQNKVSLPGWEVSGESCDNIHEECL